MYSLRHPDNEVCGIFVYKLFQSGIKFIKFDNTSFDKRKTFSLNKKLFSKYSSKYSIASLFHSHPHSSELISDFDVEVSETLALPSYIFSLQTKLSSLYYPSSYKPSSLMGRPFIHEFQDCATFLKDYYELHMDIKLSKSHKNWARQRSNSNDFLLNELNKSFFEIDKNLNKFRKGDVLIFNQSVDPFLHIGIVNSDKEYWHQPIHMFSRKELFNQELAKKVYKVYRYKGYENY